MSSAIVLLSSINQIPRSKSSNVHRQETLQILCLGLKFVCISILSRPIQQWEQMACWLSVRFRLVKRWSEEQLEYPQTRPWRLLSFLILSLLPSGLIKASPLAVTTTSRNFIDIRITCCQPRNIQCWLAIHPTNQGNLDRLFICTALVEMAAIRSILEVLLQEKRHSLYTNKWRYLVQKFFPFDVP